MALYNRHVWVVERRIVKKDKWQTEFDDEYCAFSEGVSDKKTALWMKKRCEKEDPKDKFKVTKYVPEEK